MLDIKTHEAKLFPDLIERIWTLQNVGSPTEVIVPPNPYANIIFPLDQSKYLMNGQAVETPQVEGLTLQPTFLKYPKGTKLIGVRFYPYGLHSFINLKAKKIINSSVDLLSLISPSEKLNHYTVGSNDDPMSDIYNLLSVLFNKERYTKSKALRDYYQYLREGQSMISIKEYCKIHHTNYSSLNRLFTGAIGLTPKQFERLIKFRKSLCSVIDSSDNLTEIGLNSGYFDQAHFIREFKLFLECTPSAYQKILKIVDQETQVTNYNFRLF